MESKKSELTPPWIEFPLIPWLSGNWKSGPHAFYFWRWRLWFHTLDENQKSEYLRRFPEPAGWTPFPFYDLEKLREYREHVESRYEPGPLAQLTDTEIREYRRAIRPLYEDVIRAPVERLLILLLREAAERGFTEIEIELREQDCRVRFVRDGNSIEFAPMPKRLFGPFKDCVTRKCGKIDEHAEGKFVVSLDLAGISEKAFGDANVSVTIRESSLRLTIANSAVS